jgi:hypothetical protein
MVPDIEREWIGEELRNRPVLTLRSLLVLAVLLIWIWSSCE